MWHIWRFIHVSKMLARAIVLSRCSGKNEDYNKKACSDRYARRTYQSVPMNLPSWVAVDLLSGRTWCRQPGHPWWPIPGKSSQGCPETNWTFYWKHYQNNKMAPERFHHYRQKYQIKSILSMPMHRNTWYWITPRLIPLQKINNAGSVFLGPYSAGVSRWLCV